MGRKNVNVVVGGPVQSDYPKVYNTVFIKPNIPFALQVTEPNTKYVIRHKIDLGSKGDKVSDVDFTNAHTHEIADVTYYYVPFAANGKPYTLLDDSCVFITSDWTGLSERTITPDEGTVFMIGSVTGGLHKGAYINADVITMPENCILEFDGGSLDNGVIVGQDTVFINVGDVKIWGDNLVRLGTWREHSGGSENDRPYDPEDHSGLGRKTLQLKDDSNILTQEDFDQSNTIYVVEYDFDLDGVDIQMPEGCVLDFEGGNISNGKLISNDTEVIGQLPINTNTLYGQYYRDKKPLNYNLRVTQPVNTCVDFAFITPADYVTFRFYPQSTIAFYYNNNKYHLVTGNIEGSNPERAFMLLFDKNYDFLGSTETPWPGHGGGLTVCDNQLYMCCNRNPEAQYDKLGIGVYNLSDVITACSNYDGTPHSDVYPNKIQSTRYISLPYTCADIDYDPNHEEFAVCHTRDNQGTEEYYIRIYDKEFNEKRCLDIAADVYIKDEIDSTVIFQGIVYKNGIIYESVWISDYPAVDRGGNMLCIFDAVNNKVVSFEKMIVPYQDPECEGLTKDPDDDNSLFFMCGANLEQSNTIVAICKASITDTLYGRDSKRESKSASVNHMRQTFVTVDNSYDYAYGKPNGSSKRPFKTIGTALAMAFAEGSDFTIRVAKPNEYYLPRLRFGGIHINFIGVEGKPTLKGSTWCYGANIHFDNFNIETDNYIYCSNNGYLYMTNVSLIGSQRSGIGLRVRDCANIILEGVTIYGYDTGIDSNVSSLRGTSITLRDCNKAIQCGLGNFDIETIHIENCTTGIQVRRNDIHLGTISFKDTTTAFIVDDSLIDTYGERAITLDNVTTVIQKDSDFGGRVNLMIKVQSSENLVSVINFIKQGAFYATTVGFFVAVENVVYNGVFVDKGTYIYNNPGFIREGYNHRVAVEDNNRDFTFYPTHGSYNQRPALEAIDKGFEYYDEDFKQPFFWIGYSWRELKGELYPEDHYWSKVGELTPASTTFAGGTVTISDSERTSTWEGWTNIQNSKVYQRIFNISNIPFDNGSLLRIIFKGLDRNTEWFMNYNGSGDALSVTGNIYNREALYLKTPNGDNYTGFGIVINSDIKLFDGTIEIYKSIGG